MNRFDRSTLYQHGLKEEDRTKIEGAARGTAMDSAGATAAAAAARTALLATPGVHSADDIEKAEKKAKEDYTDRETSFMSDQRQNLTGDEKIKTYTQRIKGAKAGDEKIKLLQELTDEKERKAVIKGLDEDTLAKIRVSPSFKTLPDANKTKTIINDRVNELDTEASEKFGKAETKAQGRENARGRKTIMNQINTELGSGISTTVSAEATNLSNDDIGNLSNESIDWLVTQNTILTRMKGEALIALAKHPGVSDKDSLAEKYRNFADSPTGPKAFKNLKNGIPKIFGFE